MSLSTTDKIVAEGLMAVTFTLSISILWISQTSSYTLHVEYLILVAETTACRCAISSSTLCTGSGNRTLCGLHECSEVRTIRRQFSSSPSVGALVLAKMFVPDISKGWEKSASAVSMNIGYGEKWLS